MYFDFRKNDVLFYLYSINSSPHSEKCPYLATPFPALSKAEWDYVKTKIHDEYYFKNSYADWLIFVESEEQRCGSRHQPFVEIPLSKVQIDDLTYQDEISFYDLVKKSSQTFESNVRKIIESAKELSEQRIEILSYVLVEIHEIGRDKGNDFCQIFEVRTINGEICKKILVEYLRAYEEYAIAVASAYCLKSGFDSVLFTRNQKYGWK